MGIADRIYNLAKGYVDKATSRWDEIDDAAKRELDTYSGAQSQRSAYERAQAKIEQMRAANAQSKDSMDSYAPPIPSIAPPQMPSTMEAAYRVLGVPFGSNIKTVKTAYDNLRDKIDQAKFAEGSDEQKKAQKIAQRATAAYMCLCENLDSDSDRFGRLEIKALS